MSKRTKQIKTIVYTEDYQMLASIARLHSHRIWEELAVAINQYISNYTITEIDPSSLIPKTREKTNAEQKELDMKNKIKIYLDTFKISPTDTSYKTYEECKKFIEEHAIYRELRADEIDIAMFDEVQQERRN